MRNVEVIVERGSGPPLVMVPGIQGRWEWMRPAVDALATRFRVLTFSLAGEPSSQTSLDPVVGFDSFITQIDTVLERTGVTSATVCGVSFGGLIAYRYASLRPGKVRQLTVPGAHTWRRRRDTGANRPQWDTDEGPYVRDPRRRVSRTT